MGFFGVGADPGWSPEEAQSAYRSAPAPRAPPRRRRSVRALRARTHRGPEPPPRPGPGSSPPAAALRAPLLRVHSGPDLMSIIIKARGECQERGAPPPLLSHGNGPRAGPARCPPAEEGEPGPRRPLAPRTNPRTMRPPRGRPSCRAGDLAAGHKDPHAAGVAGAGGGGRGASLRPRRGCGPRVPAEQSVQRAARDRETKGGSAGAAEWGRRWRRRRWGTWRGGESAAARAGFGEVRATPRAGRSAVRGAGGGWPCGTGAPRAWGQQCPEGPPAPTARWAAAMT